MTYVKNRRLNNPEPGALTAMDTLHAVGSVKLFAGLNPGQLRQMADIVVEKTYPKAARVFAAGDPAHGLYVVGEGRVKIYKDSIAGREHILHVFGPGEAFGEVPVFQGSAFPASAMTLEPSMLLFFPRKAFSDILRRDPELGMAMMALLSERLRALVAKVEALSLKEVPSRLATYLLLLRDAQGGETLELDMAKGQIASYLGTIQETLSRILKKMSEAGIIEVAGKTVALLDMGALERLADGERLEEL